MSRANPESFSRSQPRASEFAGDFTRGNEGLGALTGIRFFAVMHIFLFHLWSIYDLDKPEAYQNLMIGFSALPVGLVTFLSHGWLSTPFFFLLSGFILAYLYWGEDGQLSTRKKRFWFWRFSRIYPIHILLMLITIGLSAGFILSQGASIGPMVASALATLTLTQAWYPPAVPAWSWPTWALSALVFLYWITPWLMGLLSRLSRRQMLYLLAAMPVISLLPTAVFTFVFAGGREPSLHEQIFLGSTPLFWVPHFVAGMLLSRIFALSRFAAPPEPTRRTWLAWGDLAIVVVIIIACLPGLDEPLKYFLRHGLIMPLYMVIVVELARGRGVANRLFNLPAVRLLGETSFSIFIWQNLIMTLCWMSLMISPAAGHHHLWAAILGIILVSLTSTFCLEKPAAQRLRQRYLGRQPGA